MKKYSKYLIIAFSIIAFLVSICFMPINATKLIPAIETQIGNELGLKVHIDKLILRIGPNLKLKAPIMHIMYKDGHKLGQFDNAKFYISWKSLLKNNPKLTKLYANKLIVRLSSDDKYLKDLIENIQKKSFDEIPNIVLKEYNISYTDRIAANKYSTTGHLLEVSKVKNFDSIKFSAYGSLGINDKSYITYDVSLLPEINITEYGQNYNILNYLNKIKDLDFHTDIIADLKLYKDKSDNIQSSGFVNLDNITLFSASDKNKSFIYLTLLGNKIGVLSNLYASGSNKVYVDGVINTSKKPVLDLKVKTDEINLSDLHKKLKLLLDFSALKNVQSINGSLNANFTLKGDLNKIKSNGYLKINNASLLTNGVNINEIDAEIDFSNNIINIVNAVGHVNNSPIIAKGKIDKNIDIELLMNKVELANLFPKEIGIKNGLMSLMMNITGSLENIIHKENLIIDNFELENDVTNIRLENLTLNTHKSNTAYVNNLLINNKYTEVIKIPSTKLFIEEDNIKMPNTNIFMPNSKIVSQMDISNYNTKDASFNISLLGFINSKDIKNSGINSSRYPLKLNINGNNSVKNIQAQLFIEKPDIFNEPMVMNLLSRMEKNNFKIEDLSLIANNGIYTSDLKFNTKGQKKVVVNGVIEDIYKKPVFKNMRLFIPQLFNFDYNGTLAQIKGDVFLSGDVSKPDMIGQVGVSNLFNQSMQLSLANAVMDFNKNNVNLNVPLLKIGDISMSINSIISTDLLKSIKVKTLNIKSKYLNTDTVLMYKDSPAMKLKPIIISDGKLYSESAVAHIYGSPLRMSALSLDFKLNDEVLDIKNLSAEFCNGKLGGSMTYNLRDEHYSSKIMGRGVSAAPIFDIISTRKDSISGTVDFDTSLTGELTSKQSINGDVRFIVKNGRMATLGKLEHLLYAQNILADNMLRTSLSVITKAITLKDTGLFKDLRGDVLLENGLANIKTLQSQGPLMALYIRGSYNVSNDYAKLKVLGRLSDEVVSGLGAFGEFSFNKLKIMLTGEEQKHNVIIEDFDKIPQLPMKNTKEFYSVIDGIIDKPASVRSFNWISYSEKSLRQKEIPMTNQKVPDFVDKLPY